MEEILLLLIFVIANDFNMKQKNRKKRPKRFWVRKWLTMQCDMKKVLTLTSFLNFKIMMRNTTETICE